jgi:hypothetical protein
MKRKPNARGFAVRVKRPFASRRATNFGPSSDPYILGLIRQFGSNDTAVATLDPSGPFREMPEDLYFGEDWGCDPGDAL